MKSEFLKSEKRSFGRKNGWKDQRWDYSKQMLELIPEKKQQKFIKKQDYNCNPAENLIK